MSLRAGHGNGAGVPRIEVLPANELQQPQPTAQALVKPTLPAGKSWADLTPEERHELAIAWGRYGAQVREDRTRLVRSLGLVALAADHAFAGYEIAATDFVEKHLATLGAMFDGSVGEGPMSIVLTAGIQLAASRYYYDLGKVDGNAKLLGEASRLGDASRQNVLAAYELQAREAAARKATEQSKPYDVAAAIAAEEARRR